MKISKPGKSVYLDKIGLFLQKGRVHMTIGGKFHGSLSPKQSATLVKALKAEGITMT